MAIVLYGTQFVTSPVDTYEPLRTMRRGVGFYLLIFRRRVQAEHQGILKEKLSAVKGQKLTWDDMRKMDYTRKVT